MLACLACSKPWVCLKHSILEVEAEGSEIQGHPELQGEFKTNPGLHKTLPEKQRNWTSSTLKGAICKRRCQQREHTHGTGEDTCKRHI